MASGAARRETLLLQLDVGRPHMRRRSGDGNEGGGEGGGGGGGCSDPLAAGNAASAVAQAAGPPTAGPMRAASLEINFLGRQLPPPADDPLAELQQRQPSDVSVDAADMYGAFAVPESPLGQEDVVAAAEPQPRTPSAASDAAANMYGVFEDTAESLTTGNIGDAGDAVVSPAPNNSGGSCCVAAAPLNPFAAAAAQGQQDGLEGPTTAQEAADEAQWAGNRPIDIPTEWPSTRRVRSGRLDSAHERHGGIKGQNYTTEAAAAAVKAERTCGSTPCSSQDRHLQAIIATGQVAWSLLYRADLAWYRAYGCCAVFHHDS